ncbi:tetratricopeptide repeat protein [Halopiger goleimassiliensis]|uniref:tetratricopeptide repeat protein n=1 Tax=Halopiger goleimassiliensis TaxID=1293048 RepID=UPI0006777F27|nr:tetratricopeptide repeat protein [Halopiger goleimassiliensis]
MSEHGDSAEGLDELLDTVMSLKRRQKYDQAITVVDEILEAEGNPTAMSNEYALRGALKQDAGRYEAAIEDFDEAIEIDPENCQFHYQRGVVNCDRGEYEEAVEDFRAAVDLDPEDVGLQQSLAQTRLLTGAYEEAFEDATDALESSDAPDERAVSLLLTLAAGIALDEPISERETEYRERCAGVFDAGWDFSYLDAWLADADLPEEKRDRIRDLIDHLR